MAGGQERILRRRIKSVQSTKKITARHGADRRHPCGEGPGPCRGPRPYAEQITAVILDLVRPAPPREQPPAAGHAEARTSAIVVITSDRGLCGAYNSTVIRAAEREILDRRAEGHDYALYVVGKKAQPTSASAATRSRRLPRASPTSPTYEEARAIAASGAPPVRGRRLSVRSTSSTRGSSPPAPRSRRPPLPAPARSTTSESHRRRAGQPTSSSSRSPPSSSTSCCPATSSPASTRRCSTPRRPSTPPGSGR